MKKICLVFGGDSLENEISILTAFKVKSALEKFSYDYEEVYLDKDGNFYSGEGLKNKNNYFNKVKFKKVSFHQDNNRYYFTSGFFKKYFDVVLLLTHGLHAEDGTVGGYFDTLKIPCIYPGLEISCILQNKYLTKKILSQINIPICKSLLINENEFINKLDFIEEKLSYPLILKPNYLGSSIAVKKVNNKDELSQGLFEVFKYDKKALVEECVENLKEVNIALIRKQNEIIVSSTERVNDQNKILSFDDKYDNYTFNDSHIIPSDIPPKLIKKIIYYSKKAYSFLNIRTLVRFDFLVDSKNNLIYLNEINSIPGSLSYYLFEPLDIKMIDIIDILYEQYFLDLNEEKKKIRSFKDDFISSLKEK